MAKRTNVPGPGVYEIRTAVGEGPKFVMGSKLFGSMSSNNKVPGPGNYNPKFSDAGPTYSMRMKTNQPTSLEIKPDGTHERISASVDFAPGPGQYDPRKSYSNMNYGQRWGNDKRGGMENSASKIVPAPNKYDINTARAMMKTAPSYGFGTSKRPHSSEKYGSPGPGAYEIKGKVGLEACSKSLGLKLQQSKTSYQFNPGPGTYMPSPETVSKKAPTWRIGTSTRDDQEKAMLRQTRPPPGQHDPKFNSVAESAAVWSFGTSQRPAPYPSK